MCDFEVGRKVFGIILSIILLNRNPEASFFFRGAQGSNWRIKVLLSRNLILPSRGKTYDKLELHVSLWDLNINCEIRLYTVHLCLTLRRLETIKQ